MKITDIIYIHETDVINKLRQVTMLKNSTIFPYNNSFMSFEKFDTDYLFPPQNYVLIPELQSKLELKYALEKWDIDINNLNGAIKFLVEGEKEYRTILPPIIEESIESNHVIYQIICDGMHRIYLSRISRICPEIIYIRGVNKDCPYYAYPTLNGWDSIKEINSLSEISVKKWHRIKDNKRLYRNFDSIFINCSKPRK